MGSGGPRGLQILRSGASCVRGGFDSHAFPPLLHAAAGALLAATLTAAPAAAAARPAPGTARGFLGTAELRRPATRGPADSAAAPGPGADSSRAAAPSRPDSAAAAAPDTVPRSRIRRIGAAAPADTSAGPRSRFDAPRWIMLRSLAVPGWGQLANGSWLKALAVAGGEVGLGVAIAGDVRELDRLLKRVEAARAAHDGEGELEAVNAYNDRQTGLIAREWLLGGVVVYALMDAYVDAHFRHFKAEFGPPPASTGAGGGAHSRVSLRWTF